MSLFDIQRIIFGLLALLISIDIHEFFHAWVANYMGDPTPKEMGRVSLNPLVHLDPMGTVMMLLAAYSGFGFGWGKPVPINPYKMRKEPRIAMGIVGISGPISNLTIATVAAIPLRFGTIPFGIVNNFLLVLVVINISLAVFNLLPLPPLDGYNVFLAILSTIRTQWAASWFRALSSLESQGPMILLFVFMLDYMIPSFSIIGTVLGPPVRLLTRLILGS
jgi:Zn-dependent protease